MSPTAKQLLDDALRLPAEERSALAARLIDSLDAEGSEDVESAWDVEIARRIEELQSGRVTPIPWATARQMILGAANGPPAD